MKREEFLWSLLGLRRSWESWGERSAEKSKLHWHCCTKSLHLQCINTRWHVAARTVVLFMNFTCQPLAPPLWPTTNLLRTNLCWIVKVIKMIYPLCASLYCSSASSQNNEVWCSPISKLSSPVAIVHSYSYSSAHQFFLPHAQHQAVRSSGSLLSLLSHLPIMLCISASLPFSPLSPAVKI